MGCFKLLLASTMCLGYYGEPATNVASAQDIVITTPFGPGKRPTSADFYLNGRSIGKDRDAFEAIIQQVSQLPEGSSIVWGPNYARCGACSGREPACLPKQLFPDLWNNLLKAAAERKMPISSAYPGPHVRPRLPIAIDQFPKVVFADQPPADQSFAATLGWNCDPDGAPTSRDRFTLNGEELNRDTMEAAFGKIAPGSKILTRLSINQGLNDQQLDDLVSHARGVWRTNIAPRLRRTDLQSAIVVPAILFERLTKPAASTRMTIEWRNYRGPETPHNEVIYLVDRAYVGRGDQGFDQILQQLATMPQGGTVVIPRYELRGRMATEGKSRAEIQRRNDEVRELAPFRNRRKELNDLIESRNLRISDDSDLPGRVATVLSWGAGDRYASDIASFGRIVHHGETPRDAKLRLAWNDYIAHDRHKREPETAAQLTLNEQSVGRGIEAFAQVMQQFEALPAGSVIQVKVCLKTKGRFTCPLIYEGQRHFERSGYEPYFGMFDWLISEASNKQLDIDWLPDEAGSCQDCELNK